MKYSVLGFNQEQIVAYSKDNLKCDLTDLLLLNYIIYAQANPKMKHIAEDEQTYVWLQHEHVLEDLPILNISEGTLKNRLTKLRKMELLESKTVANENTRGSRTYYRTTSLLYDMLFGTTSLKNDVESGPRHSSVTSNTLANSNKEVHKNTSKEVLQTQAKTFTFGKQKLKKDNLFTKCVSMIDDYTTDSSLRSALIDYLHVRLEIKDKPLYTNSWKGLLSKLDREFDDSERLAVVRQSIERAYLSFYPVSTGKNVRSESGTLHVPVMTEEDYAEEAKQMAKLEEQGIQVRF